MRAVDTNVVVRLVARDDPRQTATAKQFIEDGVWISLPVLLETTWTLESIYGLSDAEIASTLEMLLNHATVLLQCSEAVADALKEFRRQPSLGFADCLILALARWSGHLPLGTFERRLGKLEGAVTLR